MHTCRICFLIYKVRNTDKGLGGYNAEFTNSVEWIESSHTRLTPSYTDSANWMRAKRGSNQ